MPERHFVPHTLCDAMASSTTFPEPGAAYPHSAVSGSGELRIFQWKGLAKGAFAARRRVAEWGMLTIRDNRSTDPPA